jgi:hypothetical protein
MNPKSQQPFLVYNCSRQSFPAAVEISTGHKFVDSTFTKSIQETFFILRPMDKGKNGRTLDGRSA